MVVRALPSANAIFYACAVMNDGLHLSDHQCVSKLSFPKPFRRS
jgi:hypothetical protein